MRYGLIMLLLVLLPAATATAQLSIGFGSPNVSIGINLPLYPDLEPVPGYPVYYAPRLDTNYFFYDGLYWVFQGDNWYASSWYNGPWQLVNPDSVPLYLLRVPVRYYRQPPAFFFGWQSDAQPRWGDHWGNGWAQRRSGWDHWNHRSMPAPAPLPSYQRQYAGDRYPGAAQQRSLQTRNYRYTPRDPVLRQPAQPQRSQAAPASPQRGPQGAPQQERNARPQPGQHDNPPATIQREAPRVPQAQPLQRNGPPAQQQGQQPQHESVRQPQPQHETVRQPQPQRETVRQPQPQREPVRQPQPEQKSRGEQAGPQNAEHERGGGQGNERGRPDERGQERQR